MMEPVIVLSVLSLSMLAGCYIAGTIPLIMQMSEDRMKIVSLLGAGLLVGTALTVIIPEGVHTLYSDIIAPHSDHVTSSENAILKEPTDEAGSHMEPHTVIGLALVLGFLLMLLIDQCSGGHQKSADAEAGNGRSRRVAVTATFGLVVHAAADGIALGAAAASTRTDIEMIVFIAIMLHKAPAAFGLVSFLLHEGLERSRIRRHLLLFALSAPLGTFVTYFAITQTGSASLSTSYSTGVALLFSAGTFLYVSTVHVLPELTSHDTGGHFTYRQLAVLTGGTLLPLILTLGHHH